MSVRCHGSSPAFLPLASEIDSSRKVARSSANGPDDSRSEEDLRLYPASLPLPLDRFLSNSSAKRFRGKKTVKGMCDEDRTELDAQRLIYTTDLGLVAKSKSKSKVERRRVKCLNVIAMVCFIEITRERICNL